MCERLADLKTEALPGAPELAGVGVGITRPLLLAARTGTVCISTMSSGGRQISVLPPVHVVLARPADMVPSLEDCAKAWQESNDNWSFATFITGPSRTADIEKILVLGAHGPKRLIVILIEE